VSPVLSLDSLCSRGKIWLRSPLANIYLWIYIAILRDQLRAVEVSGRTPATSHASARLPDSVFVTPVGLGRA
jgi:hypothetical protein